MINFVDKHFTSTHCSGAFYKENDIVSAFDLPLTARGNAPTSEA